MVKRKSPLTQMMIFWRQSCIFFSAILKSCLIRMDIKLKWSNFISVCEWTWDTEHKSSAAKIQDDLRTVIFHPNFSNGTAAVRGSAPIREGQHFWEIKMITPVYGTNMVSISPPPFKGRCHLKNNYLSIYRTAGADSIVLTVHYE